MTIQSLKKKRKFFSTGSYLGMAFMTVGAAAFGVVFQTALNVIPPKDIKRLFGPYFEGWLSASPSPGGAKGPRKHGRPAKSNGYWILAGVVRDGVWVQRHLNFSAHAAINDLRGRTLSVLPRLEHALRLQPHGANGTFGEYVRRVVPSEQFRVQKVRVVDERGYQYVWVQVEFVQAPYIRSSSRHELTARWGCWQAAAA